MGSAPRFGPIEVLMVEDNPGDVRLTQEAFRGQSSRSRFHVVGDGVAALDFLLRRGTQAAAPRPDLILLDLNLPRMDGRELLQEIKTHPGLRTIPVVVLTTSQAEDDIQRAYALNANCVVSKPADFDAFVHVVRAIEDFWLSVVTLPPAA